MMVGQDEEENKVALRGGRAEAFLPMTEQRIDVDDDIRDRVHKLFEDYYAEEE